MPPLQSAEKRRTCSRVVTKLRTYSNWNHNNSDLPHSVFTQNPVWLISLKQSIVNEWNKRMYAIHSLNMYIRAQSKHTHTTQTVCIVCLFLFVALQFCWVTCLICLVTMVTNKYNHPYKNNVKSHSSQCLQAFQALFVPFRLCFVFLLDWPLLYFSFITARILSANTMCQSDSRHWACMIAVIFVRRKWQTTITTKFE